MANTISDRELRDANGMVLMVWFRRGHVGRVRRFIAKRLFALTAMVLRCEIKAGDI